MKRRRGSVGGVPSNRPNSVVGRRPSRADGHARSVFVIFESNEAGVVELPDARGENKKITLSGGSLGSCVDEERSQLRDLM